MLALDRTGCPMPSLLELLTPERVISQLRVATKSDALRQLAGRAAAAVGLPEDKVFQALCRREALGSTAIGRGVAIPHAVLPALGQSFCLFALTATPIPFDAVDGYPVSAIFVFLTPEDCAAESTHLLARVCRTLRDPPAIPLLRQAVGDAALHDTLTRLLGNRQAA